METFNFTFYAQGADQEDALRILNETWRVHCEEYVDAHHMGDLVAEWGVRFVELQNGWGVRDDVVIFQEDGVVTEGVSARKER